MKSRYKTTEITLLKARGIEEWKMVVEDTTNKSTVYLDKEDMWKLLQEIYMELK